MKSLKSIIAILLLFMAPVSSCKDDYSVDLSDRPFVRLNKTSVSITAGEKYNIRATMDTLGSASKQFNWSIMNPEIASIETTDTHSAVITGLSAGNTIIKIESTDGELKYFSDLSVSKDRVIKILAIGNSFSEDAIENYLYDLAKAAGHKVIIGNLYYGGRSLQTHWEKASTNGDDYSLRMIATDGSKNVFNNTSIQQAVERENWDYISFQQVSQLSGISETYHEYLPKLVEYVKSFASNPELKFILHQTWAYAEDSNHDGFKNYDHNQIKMFNAIVDAAWKAKDLTQIDMIIPAGTAIQNGRTSYIGDKFTRDGYHLNQNIGRFTAASAWYEAIFGNVLNNDFVPDKFSNYDVLLAKTAAAKAVTNPKEVTVLTDFAYPAPNEFKMTKPIMIDFGPAETEGFNNFKNPKDLKLIELKDTDGTNSDFAIEVSQQFSGTLSRGLQNVLGLPKSVSEDMFFSDGIRIEESGFIISNLNKSQQYTLVFYGSINDNKTETEFRAIGKNEAFGYLDNDNNLGKVVVLENIEPAADATITIKMKPGPNNQQWARFFGVNAMMILPAGMPVPIEQNDFKLEHPVYIDFGTREAASPFYFFDRPSDAPRYNLMDEKGNNTGYAMSITSRFNGENQSGTFENTLGLPGEVTVDAFWSDQKNPNSGFTIYKLNSTQKYQFIFYGSRNGAGDNRETKYVVKGANEGSGLLNTSNNKSNVAIIKGIQPAADGTIDIRISTGPNNNNASKFYYINAMIITPDGYTLPGM